MKKLFLIIKVTHVFSQQNNIPIYQEIVTSPENAAVVLWRQSRLGEISVEPPSYDGYLYELDFENKTIETIEIPEIEFSYKAVKDQ